jgi:hypothetical protein
MNSGNGFYDPELHINDVEIVDRFAKKKVDELSG